MTKQSRHKEGPRTKYWQLPLKQRSSNDCLENRAWSTVCWWIFPAGVYSAGDDIGWETLSPARWRKWTDWHFGWSNSPHQAFVHHSLPLGNHLVQIIINLSRIFHPEWHVTIKFPLKKKINNTRHCSSYQKSNVSLVRIVVVVFRLGRLSQLSSSDQCLSLAASGI